MKKQFLIFFLLLSIFLISILFVGCPETSSGNSGGSGGGGNGDGDAVPINYNAMVTVPAITNFPRGYTDVAVPVHTVISISSFRMGKYEVTYNQWYTVRVWSVSNGYTFSNLGLEGYDGTYGAAPTTKKYEPVTTINWRDALVWCNAASQYEGLTPVYYTNAGLTSVLKVSTNTESINTTAGSEDNPYVNWSSNGYRLPTEAEWEAAARYINGTIWLRGDAPSGWIDNSPADGNWRIEDPAGIDDWLAGEALDNYNEVNTVAWWSSNGGLVTHVAGTKNANQLGIYDMNGNVWEWCWDWYGVYIDGAPYTDPNSKGHAYDPVNPYRMNLGGSWNLYSEYLQSSYRYAGNPYFEYAYFGFRVARSN